MYVGKSQIYGGKSLLRDCGGNVWSTFIWPYQEVFVDSTLAGCNRDVHNLHWDFDNCLLPQLKYNVLCYIEEIRPFNQVSRSYFEMLEWCQFWVQSLKRVWIINLYMEDRLEEG